MAQIVNLREFISDVCSGGAKQVLLACLQWDGEMSKQMRILESVCLQSTSTCIVDQDSMSGFREAFHIEGTPTFLLFERGEEKRRMLGHADAETLHAFIEGKRTAVTEEKTPRFRFRQKRAF